MSVTISVVVPVYNVEEYLVKCLNSLLNQTKLPNEIILVDDGSLDKSGEICDEYAKRYKEIKVIHQENAGLSEARNTGLRVATAEYIMFVDSDDDINLDSCEMLIKAIGELSVDIVTARSTTYLPNKKIYKKHTSKDGIVVSGIDFLKNEYKHKTMFVGVPHCIYSRTFLLENRISFIPGLLHEDEVFTPTVFIKAKKVLPTNIYFYNYYQREDSICTKKDKTPNAKAIIEICYMLETLVKNTKDIKLKKLMLDHCIDMYYVIFVNANLVDNTNIRLDKKYLKKYCFSLKNKFRTFLYCLNERLLYNFELLRRKK